MRKLLVNIPPQPLRKPIRVAPARPLRYVTGTLAEYKRAIVDGLITETDETLYFILDTCEIYRGLRRFSMGDPRMIYNYIDRKIADRVNALIRLNSPKEAAEILSQQPGFNGAIFRSFDDIAKEAAVGYRPPCPPPVAYPPPPPCAPPPPPPPRPGYVPPSYQPPVPVPPPPRPYPQPPYPPYPPFPPPPPPHGKPDPYQEPEPEPEPDVPTPTPPDDDNDGCHCNCNCDGYGGGDGGYVALEGEVWLTFDELMNRI